MTSFLKLSRSLKRIEVVKMHWTEDQNFQTSTRMAPGDMEPIRNISWLGKGTFSRNSWDRLVIMRNPSTSGWTWLWESNINVKLSLLGERTKRTDPRLRTTAPEAHQTSCTAGDKHWASCSQNFLRKSEEPIHITPLKLKNVNIYW